MSHHRQKSSQVKNRRWETEKGVHSMGSEDGRQDKEVSVGLLQAVELLS